MIYSVTGQNFGPHAKFHYDLAAGINLFLGPNGCGKSNIVYLIGWAILGPRALPPAYSQQDIIHDGSDEASGSVDLDFAGRRLTFSRSYNGRTTKARVVDSVSGEVLADNATGVTSFLTACGFDWDAASVPFCRQRDLDAFVHESPANRKKIIASLLQLDSLDGALRYVREKKARLPEMVEAPDVDTCRLRCAATASDVQAANAGLVQKQVEAARAEQELSTATLALPSDDHAAERTQRERELATLDANILLCERQLPLLHVESPLEDHTDFVTQCETFVDEAARLKRQWETTLTARENEIRELITQHDAFLTLVDGVIDTQHCTVCDSDLDAKTIPGLKLRAQQLRDNPTPDTTSADLAANAVGEAELMLQEVRHKLAEAQEHQRSYILQQEKLDEATLLQEKLNDLRTEKAKADRALEALPAPPGRDHFRAVQSLSTTHTAAQKQVLKWEREVHRTSDLDTDAQNDLASAITATTQQKENQELTTTIKATEKALKIFRDQLLRGALTWVSRRATQVLQASGDMAVAPAGSRLELDEKLVYSVVLPDGMAQPVYRVSGGQAAVFSTCLRIALSEYLAGRMGMDGLLLLDAIFEPMNADNRAIAAEAIRAYGPPQTLLFSYFDVPELGANIISVGEN